MTAKTEEIVSLFKEISKPYKDKEGGPKLDTIKEYLGGIDSEYEEDVGLIVNKCKSPDIVIVSHIDLISKFQKGFAKDKICDVNEGYIVGALDNTITNAIAIMIMKEIKEEQGDVNIELFLSEGEEVGLVGMKNYLKRYKEKSENTFFINLDVTNDGYGKDISIEYDRPDYHTVKSVQEILGEYRVNIQGERECDDMDAINSESCCGFSFCLPTTKNIHSYKNKAKLESLENYFNALKVLVQNIKINKEYKVFSSYEMRHALKCKTFKKFKKRTCSPIRKNTSVFIEDDRNIEENFNYSNDEYVGYIDNNDEDFEEKIFFSVMLSDYLFFENRHIFDFTKYNSDEEKRLYIENLVRENRVFDKNEFIVMLKVNDYYCLEEVFERLIDSNILIKESETLYSFNYKAEI